MKDILLYGCYEKDYIPGFSVHRNLLQLLSASDKIVVVLCKAFLKSPLCKYELDVAQSMCIRDDKEYAFIPVILDDCEIPESLVVTSCLDVSSDISLWWTKFLNAIECEERSYRSELVVADDNDDENDLLHCLNRLLQSLGKASVKSQQKFLQMSRISGLSYFVSQMGQSSMLNRISEACGISTFKNNLIIDWAIFHDYLINNNHVVKDIAHYIDYVGVKYSKLSFIFKTKMECKDLKWKSNFKSFAELVLVRRDENTSAIRPLQDFNGHDDGFIPEVAQLTEVLLQIFPPCKKQNYYKKYHSYESRLKSFETCLAKNRINPEEFAAAGFFFSGYTDLVACFACGMRLFGWKKDDDPWVNHAYYRPFCIHVTENKNDEFVKYARQSLHAKLRTQRECEEFRTFESRIQSFVAFTFSFVDPYDLADAGFYYCVLWKQSDNVRCFSCGLQLHDWQSRDHPWVEHAKHSPSCNFVLSQKGIAFVNMIQSKFKHLVDQNLYELIFTFGNAMRVDDMLEISKQESSTNNDIFEFLNDMRKPDVAVLGTKNAIEAHQESVHTTGAVNKCRYSVTSSLSRCFSNTALIILISVVVVLISVVLMNLELFKVKS